MVIGANNIHSTGCWVLRINKIITQEQMCRKEKDIFKGINRSSSKCLIHILIFIFIWSFFPQGFACYAPNSVNSCVNCTLLGRGLLSIHFSLVGKKMLPHISIFIFIPCHLVLCSFSWVSVPPIVLTTLMCKHSWRWSAFWKQYSCNLFQIVFTLPNKWHLHFQRKTKKVAQ